MNCTGTDCTCGCCAGTSVQTPQAINNLPGLSAVSYRAGTWGTFKASMLARLSSSDYPALAPLKTRSDDDFTIAFLDATSVVLDILTFYQERLVNESYLRTAVQLRSLTELSRLIGYQPVPGVSASAYLAFTLKAAPGQVPDPSTPAITIPAGTRAQSVPAQNQAPQTFETSTDITAKADWNTLAVESDQPWIPPGSNGVYLSGTATQLQRGDRLLILGAAREQWDGNVSQRERRSIELPREQWELVTVQTVTVDTILKLTYVSWGTPETHLDPIPNKFFRIPDWTTAKVFALRQRASLFGHNAPSPYLFINAALSANGPVTSLPTLIDVKTDPNQWAWDNYAIQSSTQVDLDAIYSRFTPGSWVVMLSAGSAQLYQINSASTLSRSAFTLSAKVTELALDYADANLGTFFQLPTTEVLGQSEELQVAGQPLTWPLYGTLIDLETLRPDLVGVQAVVLSGSGQKLAVAAGITGLTFLPDDSTLSAVTLDPGDSLTVIDPTGLPLDPAGSALDWLGSTAPLSLRVQDSAGRSGTVTASTSQFTLLDAGSKDPVVREFALVTSVTSAQTPRPHTRIQLQTNLQHCYNRAVTTVNANVALATHGQSVSEIMGSGSASTPNQNFTLRQSPLTFVHAPTPTGRQSTLKVRANGMLWTEVRTLYGEGSAQQVFATATQDDQTTDVVFGDGMEGSTLPTGQNNLQATYRVGSARWAT